MRRVLYIFIVLAVLSLYGCGGGGGGSATTTTPEIQGTIDLPPEITNPTAALVSKLGDTYIDAVSSQITGNTFNIGYPSNAQPGQRYILIIFSDANSNTICEKTELLVEYRFLFNYEGGKWKLYDKTGVVYQETDAETLSITVGLPVISGIVKLPASAANPFLAVATLDSDGLYHAVKTVAVAKPTGDGVSDVPFKILCPSLPDPSVKYHLISFADTGDSLFQQPEYLGECQYLLTYNNGTWQIVDRFGAIIYPDATLCKGSQIIISLEFP